MSVNDVSGCFFKLHVGPFYITVRSRGNALFVYANVKGNVESGPLNWMVTLYCSSSMPVNILELAYVCDCANCIPVDTKISICSVDKG